MADIGKDSTTSTNMSTHCTLVRNEYNYYCVKHLVCNLYQYIFASNTKKFADLLDLILGCFKHHEDTHGNYVFKQQDDALFNYLYKLVFYTRNTLNMFDLTYIQIIIWDKYYPEVAKDIITKLVFSDSSTVHEDDVSNTGYGCWRDIKHICHLYAKYYNIPIKYLTFNTIESYYQRNYDLPSLIKHCLYLYKKQLCFDLQAIKSGNKVSMMAKWVPREKSQQFGWIYRHLVIHLSDRMDCEKDLHFVRKWLRKELSKLNRCINTVQINMCENKWGDIDPSHITSETYRRNKLAILNITSDSMIRYPSNDDRVLCAVNTNQYTNSRCNGMVSTLNQHSNANELVDKFIVHSRETVKDKLYSRIGTRMDDFTFTDKQTIEGLFTNTMKPYLPSVVDNLIVAIDLASSYKYCSANNTGYRVNPSIDRFYSKDLPHVNAITVADRIIKSSNTFTGFISLNNTWEECKNMSHIETISTIIEKGQYPYGTISRDLNGYTNNIDVFDSIVYNIYISLYNKIKNDNTLISQIRERKLNLGKHTILFLGNKANYTFTSYPYLMSIVEQKYKELGELILPKQHVSHNKLILVPPKLVFWDTSDGIDDRNADNNSIHFISKLNPYVSFINPRKFSCLIPLIKPYKWPTNGYSNANLAMKQWSETQRSLIETLFKGGINELLMFNRFTNFTHAIDRSKYSELNVFE